MAEISVATWSQGIRRLVFWLISVAAKFDHSFEPHGHTITTRNRTQRVKCPPFSPPPIWQPSTLAAHRCSTELTVYGASETLLSRQSRQESERVLGAKSKPPFSRLPSTSRCVEQVERNGPTCAGECLASWHSNELITMLTVSISGGYLFERKPTAPFQPFEVRRRQAKCTLSAEKFSICGEFNRPPNRIGGSTLCPRRESSQVAFGPGRLATRRVGFRWFLHSACPIALSLLPPNRAGRAGSNGTVRFKKTLKQSTLCGKQPAEKD
ncbi:unnamed protein product [Protopolystoma xenopodis]|uniref:Uncharacterized protein n=1 Tax=Protopolystoma xenopodis TaxID=117903 RepID=A0A3S5BCQ4_9PLAT|nr:unnamed protein product [Protopolystoma xenopodis]